MAIAIPGLWRAIQISVSYQPERAAAQFELLKTWLFRPDSLPLSLRISNPTFDAEILRIAVLHSER
jgi:hypothetical protein